MSFNIPSLPAFDEGSLTDKKTMRRVLEYLVQLDEYVRYAFRHIGEESLDAELLGRIGQGGRDADLEQRVEDVEGNVSSVKQTAQSLEQRVQSAEGNASEAKQTADGVSTRMTNVEGSIAQLDITASGIMAAVNNNRLSFSASGLRIKNAYGQVVFDQGNQNGDLSITGNMSATGGSIGGLQVTPYGLFYYGMLAIDISGSYPEIRIGGLTLSGNPYQGMIYGDPEAPIFAVNQLGVYVGRWQ